MGGNAVHGVGVIHISELCPTLRQIELDLGLTSGYLDENLLGSAGKREYSGDIDVVMHPVDSDGMKAFSDILRTRYGQFNVKKAGNMFNVAVPIIGYNESLQGRIPRTGTVQVDFIFAEPEYTKLFNFSPGDKSKYKGVHRNLAISAISGYTDRYTSDELDGFGRPIETIRWKFSTHGFFKISRKSRYNTNGEWIKSQKDEQIGTTKTDPLLIAEILFGDGAQVGDLDSLETIIAACKRFFDEDKQQLIYSRIAFNLKEYNARSEKVDLSSYGVPDEIAPYM